MENKGRWGRFAFEIDKLIYFWIFGIFYFFLFRVAFILIYRNEVGPHADTEDFVKTFMMGIKFDSTVMGYFMLISLAFLFLLVFFDKFKLISGIRSFFQYLFVVWNAFVLVIGLNYYKEYKSQFDNFVFLGLYDDRGAVFQTIVEYHNFYLNLAIIILLMIGGILFFRLSRKWTLFSNKLANINSKYGRALIVVLVLVLFVGALRGSFSNRPAKRRWAAVAKDDFLNKTVLNPYSALRYAYADFRELNGNGTENPYLKEDLSRVFEADSVSQIIVKEASGNLIEKPKQIFLVLMESYDCWSLMDKYKAFKVSENLRRIAQNGTQFTNMLPANVSTFDAYSTLVAGVPYCGVNTSLLGTSREPYLSSIFNQFERLGYKTNLFYGGFISWQNIGEFSKFQGCDKVYSAVDMGGEASAGAWAVEDETLFDFILSKLDNDEYTLNIVLTSSRHSPYDVDVHSKGFPYEKTDDLPQEVRPYFDGAMSMVELGHVWYGDYAIGKFMDKAEEKYKDALFAFTGDHFGRKFINHTPDLYERSLVPFILYGKDVPYSKDDTPASHMDVLPTLIEMVAPEGFKYYSFGKSVFSPHKEYAFGFTKAIDRDSLLYFPKDALIDEINLLNFKEKKCEVNKYKSSYDSIMGLSWHYIMNGNLLKKE